MKGFNVHSFLRMIIVGSTAISFAFVFYSCKKVYMANLELGALESAEQEVQVASRFPSLEEIRNTFHADLPDSGIVPVEVVIRNSGDRVLTIHHSNGMELPEGFRGVTLNVNGVVFHPLRPVDVLAIVRGIDLKRFRYSGLSAGRAIIGTMVAPYGGYLIYNELKYGRFYRALKKQSLFATDRSGLLEAVILEPGDEVRGFLYFDLPEELNPYTSVDSLARDRLEAASVEGGAKGIIEKAKSKREKKKETEKALALLRNKLLQEFVNGRYELEFELCFSVSDVDTVSFYDVLLARKDCPTSAVKLLPGRERKSSGIQSLISSDWLFALAKEEGSKKRMKLAPLKLEDFLNGRLPELEEGASTGKNTSAAVLSSTASIADCAVCGSRVCTALNFKSSSSIYLWDMSEEGGLLFKKKFPRRIKRVALRAEFVSLLSARDFLYILPIDRPGRVRRIKLGRDVSDACSSGDILYAVQENGMLKKLAMSTEGKLRVEIMDTLAAGDIRLLGVDGKSLYLMRIEKFSFSIASYDIERMGEVSLAELQGSPSYFHFENGKLFLQLTNGVFVRFRLSEGKGLEIEGQGYVPFDIRAVDYLPDGLCLFGTGGEFTFRPENDYMPCSIDRVAVSTKVKVLPLDGAI